MIPNEIQQTYKPIMEAIEKILRDRRQLFTESRQTYSCELAREWVMFEIIQTRTNIKEHLLKGYLYDLQMSGKLISTKEGRFYKPINSKQILHNQPN
jgi:hypothetical protein